MASILVLTLVITLTAFSGRVKGIPHSNVSLFIIDGEPAKISDVPWQVVLGVRNTANKTITYYCGGTIIDKYWVLTAAHCLTDDEVVNGNLVVVAGISNLEDILDKNIFNVINSHSHPQFDVTHNDIAILQVDRDLESVDGRVVLLNTEDSDSGPAIISGFGKTDPNPDSEDIMSSQLMKAEVNIIDSKWCQQAYDEMFTEKMMICTGTAGGGRTDKAGCTGDSGGALVVEKGNTSYLVGILSYGPLEGCDQGPGVWTRVSSYLDWIRQTTSASGSPLTAHKILIGGFIVIVFGWFFHWS